MIMILPSWKSWLTPTCRMAAAVGVCKEIENMMTNEERMKVVNDIDDILGDWTNSGDDFYLQQAMAMIRAKIEKEEE